MSIGVEKNKGKFEVRGVLSGYVLQRNDIGGKCGAGGQEGKRTRGRCGEEKEKREGKTVHRVRL